MKKYFISQKKDEKTGLFGKSSLDAGITLKIYDLILLHHGMMTEIRPFREGGLASILEIYNQGIQDRVTTLERDTKDMEYMKAWFERNPYALLLSNSSISVL